MTETNDNSRQREIELLAPARDAATARAAIDHGADAVYMGASSFGARSQAANSIAEIADVSRYAHRFGARLYVTVNTIVYDHELDDVRNLMWDLWRAGVDALIVQDLALTQLDDLPPIALHASTQCDTRDVNKARFLEQCGFTRLVLARELTLNEIKAISDSVKTDIEAFVHGALCVSYSGDCQASYVITGRSANRGMCCQVCRFKFDLEDGAGHKLIKGKHLLSLRDMNRLHNLEQMLDAGVSSLKIEGRLKDENYVKNVVGAYRRRLDEIIAANPEHYIRSSVGRSSLTFEPDPAQSFNRGFTNYFLTSPQPAAGSLATFGSPKWTGIKVGVVRHISKKAIVADLDTKLNNGDGLGYYTTDGEFKGFRLNKVEGNRLYPAGQDLLLPPGTIIYRNADKQRSDLLSGTTATRKIDVTISLRLTQTQAVLTMADAIGLEVSVAEEIEYQEARSPQTERRRKELEKLGDTIFNAVSVSDKCGDIFIPASTLSRLRRRAVEMLEMSRLINHRREKQGKKSSEITIPVDHTLTRHDNIANRVAAQLYAGLTGLNPTDLPRAIEVSGKPDKETRIMQTRYCLRRELGACLKTSTRDKLPTPLYLTSEGKKFRLDFNCKDCRMEVIHLPG